MDRVNEQPRFEVQPIIKQKPFENSSVEGFFEKWCEANDSIEPKIIDRKEWNQKEAKDIFIKEPDNKHTLYLPKDLHLWEMVKIVSVIDKNTFDTKPERQDEAKKKILDLGKTFKNAGIYIAKRLDNITQGQEIARDLVQDFYNYGQSLLSEKQPKKTTNIQDIASQTLTNGETEEIDLFLAGEKLYNLKKTKNQKMIDKDRDALLETERQKTLSQFFSVSQKAFELKGKENNGELYKGNNSLKPWQKTTSTHNNFISKIETSIGQKIEIPKIELEKSLLRRGMEFLQRDMPFDRLSKNMKDTLLFWQNGETTLYQALQIDKSKAELETVKKTGDIIKISEKEREITNKIQAVVSRYNNYDDSHYPSFIMRRQSINCVGASMLSASLMKEVGLNFLVGSIPGHSILLLATSDGMIEWRDMLCPSDNEIITNEMIKCKKDDGTSLTTSDIQALNDEQKSDDLVFKIEGKKNRKNLIFLKDIKEINIIAYKPEIGLNVQALNNLGMELINQRYINSSIIVFNQANAIYSKNADTYYGLGIAYLELGQNNKAVENFQQAISINPEYAAVYNDLRSALYRLNKYDEAREVSLKYDKLPKIFFNS